MAMRYFIITSMLFSLAAAQTPAGLQRWLYEDPAYPSNSSFSMQIGGPPRNYIVDGAWTRINNNFVIDGDSAYCHTALLKTTVKPNGLVKVRLSWEGVDYTVAQQLNRIIFFRKADSAWINIDPTQAGPDWKIPDIVSNTVTWIDVFPGVDYGVKKQDGKVRNRIIFKPAFLDSAVTLYNQRPDSADIYLASVHSLALSATIDSYNARLGNVSGRILKRIGSLAFEIVPQTLHFLGPDTLPEVPVAQRYVFVGPNLYLVEFVKMAAIKQIHAAYPSAPVWHYDEFTLDNDTDIEDTWLRSWQADVNFGAAGNSFLYNDAGSVERYIIRAAHVNDSIGTGQEIDSAFWHIYITSHDGTPSDPYLYCYGVWKNQWVENLTSTWNRWGANLEWTTGGCDNASDNASFNAGDGTGADRTSAYTTTTLTGTGEIKINISSWMQTCYDSLEAVSALFHISASNDGEYHDSREGTNEPYLVVYYSAAGGGSGDISYARRKRARED
jgi:hypothetical protein